MHQPANDANRIPHASDNFNDFDDANDWSSFARRKNQTVVVQPEDEEVIYISREKILEFAKILNEAIDTTELEAIPFIERIPLGMYAFEYESKEDGDTEGNDVSYQVMVYNSTADAYKKFMTALPNLFKELGRFAYEDDSQEYLSQDTLERLLKHCKENFFSGEMIPPYYEDDIKHILEYYAQKGACPQFYTFAQVDRERLDVANSRQCQENRRVSVPILRRLNEDNFARQRH